MDRSLLLAAHDGPVSAGIGTFLLVMHFAVLVWAIRNRHAWGAILVFLLPLLGDIIYTIWYFASATSTTTPHPAPATVPTPPLFSGSGERSTSADAAVEPEVKAERFCPFCGEGLQGTFMFCPACGKRQP